MVSNHWFGNHGYTTGLITCCWLFYRQTTGHSIIGLLVPWINENYRPKLKPPRLSYFARYFKPYLKTFFLALKNISTHFISDENRKWNVRQIVSSDPTSFVNWLWCVLFPNSQFNKWHSFIWISRWLPKYRNSFRQFYTLNTAINMLSVDTAWYLQIHAPRYRRTKFSPSARHTVRLKVRFIAILKLIFSVDILLLWKNTITKWFIY